MEQVMFQSLLSWEGKYNFQQKKFVMKFQHLTICAEQLEGCWKWKIHKGNCNKTKQNHGIATATSWQ
jgi:hypothetical protein